jgi:hypothetical protein
LYTNASYAKEQASATLGSVHQSYNDGTLSTKATEKAGKAYNMLSAMGGSLISRVQSYQQPGEPEEPTIREENKD